MRELVTWSAWTNEVWYDTGQFHGYFILFLFIGTILRNYFVIFDTIIHWNYSGLGIILKMNSQMIFSFF